MRPGRELPAQFAGQVDRLARAGHEHTGGYRDEQGRHGAGEPVADGQEREHPQRLVGGHPVLKHADRKTADEIHKRDHHAGDRLPPNKPAGAVHAREEVGLPLQFQPRVTGLLAGEGAGLHLGVDRHLPARQAVEREPGGHFARSRRAGRDHDKLNHGDDHKHHRPNEQVVGRDEAPEGGHDVTRRGRSVDGSPREDQPGRRDIEHQPDERGPQKERGKDRHFQRRAGGQGAQEREHRHGEVGRQEEIHEGRRHRGQYHRHGHEDGRRQRVVGDVGGERPAKRGGGGERLGHAGERSPCGRPDSELWTAGVCRCRSWASAARGR